jgi:hypothetical protein
MHYLVEHLFSSGNWDDSSENSRWYDNSTATDRSPSKVLPDSNAGILKCIVIKVQTKLLLSACFCQNVSPVERIMEKTEVSVLQTFIPIPGMLLVWVLL